MSGFGNNFGQHQQQQPPFGGGPPPPPQQQQYYHHHQSAFGGGLFGAPPAPPPAPTFNFGGTAAPAPAQPSTVVSGGSSAPTTAATTATTTTTTWYPKKLDMEEIMKDLVEIHEGSDISFSFSTIDDNDDSNNNNNNNDEDGDGGSGGGDNNNSKNKNKNGSLLLYAHKGILAHRSPQLYDLIKDATDGETIEILNVKRSVFKHLLVNVYTGVVPLLLPASKKPQDLFCHDEGIEFATDLLLASDQFGMINLKLSLQSLIIDHGLDTSNVADWLLLADNHNCALLKESCMELITEFTQEVMATPSWSAVEESKTLGFELFKYSISISNNNNKTKNNGKSSSTKKKKSGGGLFDTSYDAVDFDESWSVSELLSILELLGLELDGTKKMLIGRLKEYHYEQRQQQQQSGLASAAFPAAVAEQQQQQAAAAAAAFAGGADAFAAAEAAFY